MGISCCLLSIDFCIYCFLNFVNFILKECDIAQKVFFVIVGDSLVRPVMSSFFLITMFESIRIVPRLLICLLMIRWF